MPNFTDDYFYRMKIDSLYKLFNTPARQKALQKLIADNRTKTIHITGLQGSATSLLLSSLLTCNRQFILVANDTEEAGYLYHDFVQIQGEENILFFPSGYKRAIKYGQVDAANEILRTETLNRLQQPDKFSIIVTCPEALAEKVVRGTTLSEKTIHLAKNEKADITRISDTLFEYGFERVDYVYEPGQYAMRGSILDVYSFSFDQPYRIDFFGDDIESIRSFDVESQLSREQLEEIFIIPNMSNNEANGISLLDFIDSKTIFGFKDLAWCIERITELPEKPFQTNC